MKTLISNKYVFMYHGMEHVWSKCWSEFIKNKGNKYTESDGDIDGTPSYTLNKFISNSVWQLIHYINKHNVRIVLNHVEDLDKCADIIFTELHMDIGLDIGVKIDEILDNNANSFIDVDVIEDMRYVLGVFVDKCFDKLNKPEAINLYKDLIDELNDASDKLNCVGFILDTFKVHNSCVFHGIELIDLIFITSLIKTDGSFDNVDLLNKYTNKDHVIVADGKIVHYILSGNVNRFDSIKIYKYKPEIIEKISKEL